MCTPALLDGLKERGVKATFFLVGENVETYPDIVKRIYEEGHLIGNHTYHHVEITKLSDEEAMYEINKTDELVAAITGQRVAVYPSAFWGLEERTGELSGRITCHVDGRPFGLDYGKYR